MRGRAILINNIPVPCKGCQFRYIGCHQDCYEYAKYRKSMDECNNQKEAVKTKENDLRAVKIDAINQLSRRKARQV